MAIEMKKYVSNLTYGKELNPIKIKIGFINYKLIKIYINLKFIYKGVHSGPVIVI